MDGGDLAKAGAPPWAIDFVDGLVSSLPDGAGWDLLFHVFRIAHRLDVPTLSRIAAAKVASRLCGWGPDKLEVLFDQGRNISPDEERLIRARESWVSGTCV